MHYVMPGFAPSRLCARAMSKIPCGGRATFLYNHYPLSRREEYEHLCLKYGLQFFDSGGDRGLHGSLNNWLDSVKLPDDELICVFDPDSDPDPGFHVEAERVMRKYPIGWLSLRIPGMEMWSEAWTEQDGVLYLPTFAHMHTSTFLTEAVRKLGGFREPQQYYGGMEGDMDPRLKEAGYAVGWLANHHDRYWETPESLTDSTYRMWRRVYGQTYHKSFAEFLDEADDLVKQLGGTPAPRP